MTTTTLITVAPTGAESAKADVPALPVTLDELVATAKECEARRRERHPRAHPRRRGPADARPGPAARHRRRAAGEHRPDRPALHAAARCTDPEADRLAVLDAGPDMASCTMGTVNFGDDVFLNRWEFIVDLHTRMQERGIVPEYEIFDLGHLTVAAAAARQVRAARRRARARRLRDGRAGRDARHRRGAGRLRSRRCATCPRAPRSRPPASAARTIPVHARLARRPAGTCGSAWRTRSRTPRASRSSRNMQLVARAVGVRPARPAPAADAGRRPGRCSANLTRYRRLVGMTYAGGVPLAEVVRSGFVEGCHHGSVVVLDADRRGRRRGR